MSWHEHELGFEWENDLVKVFFGKKGATLDSLAKAFPDYELRSLHQVHGNTVVECGESGVKADAHWTDKKGVALCIQTADCTPVFFHAPQKNLISAAHAGWRGVASQILSQVVLNLAYKGANFRDIDVFVGPHIGFESFEVGKDVKAELLAAIPNMNDREMRKAEIYRDLSEEKSLVDLAKIVKAQLDNFSIPEDSVHWLRKDTFSDKSFHSHRRDKELAGRQISFIVQK